MSNRKATEEATEPTTGAASALPVRHPESGRRYSLEELELLVGEGDPWALAKMDEWNVDFSNEYKGPLKDRCPDPECDQYGEPVTLCYDARGELLEIDHGGRGHAPAVQTQAKAS
ncbi:hypothetical protein ABIB35_002709 [Arthrobacter sp. UYP6]|uniref:hypothetical protein n=1 Tax=Arthrobacter sp. UYP6 TaxID=1756378 RepID=UPI003392CFEB